MIYGSNDAREFPLYSLTDVSRALHVPRSTLYRWLRNDQNEPVISTCSRGKAFNFFQLSEAFVVAYLRRRLRIPLSAIRQVSQFLRQEGKTRFPLVHLGLHIGLQTGSDENLTRAEGLLLSVSPFGKRESAGIIGSLLDRFEFEEDGLPSVIHPWIPGTETKSVRIDPRVRFGQPTISGTGITVTSIFERFEAGESTENIAVSYGTSHSNVESAIAYAAG